MSRSSFRFSAGEWTVFCCLAVASVAAWLRFGYPQFSPVDLSVGKRQALESARDFLAKRGADPRGYAKSVIFDSDGWADSYLQKTLGLEQEEAFAGDNGCELFYWKVRFFREFEKEEYVVEVSPRTGAVIAFSHTIPEVEAREPVQKEAAAERAAAFLRDRGLDFSNYEFNEEKAKQFDNRTDYSFSWKKKGVYIPWKAGKGGSKLISGVTVSGSEVREFYVNKLDLPENFYRYIERQMFLGEYISSFAQLLFAVFIIFSLITAIGRRHNLAFRSIQGRVLAAAGVLAAVHLLSILNDLQVILFNYSTSASLASYFGIYFLQSLMGLFFLGLIFAAPVLGGEMLQREEPVPSRAPSLTHYMRASFLTRGVSRLVVSGYLLFFILLGLQAVIFFFGQKYLGVWKQWIKLTQFSSAYLPFFSAFALAMTASLTEEGVFRLFGITWGKKIFRSTFAAVVFASLAWGFGHTQYAIFPVWFRGIEVSLIGLVYGFIFLRYGIIPLITAHYLFDVFWGVSPFILGKSTPYLFAGSAAVLALPLLFALGAYLRNGSEEEREDVLHLSPSQKFNLGVLRAFIGKERSAGVPDERLRGELLSHHWDVSLIDLAMKEGKSRND